MKKIIFFIISLILSYTLFAQVTTQGKDFYVAFGANAGASSADNANLELQIRFIATNKANVTIKYTESGLEEKITVEEGSVYTYNLNANAKKAAYTNTSGTNSKSIFISSDEYISVFALNLYNAITDATNILPINTLGTEYYHLSYQATNAPGDGYLLIATDDNTIINKNGSYLTTLNKGQVYTYYQNQTELTGTKITADKPISYFATNACTLIPAGFSACDCLYQQIAPVSVWGNSFLVPVTVQGKERIRVLASQNNTVVTHIGGTLITGVGKGNLTLNAGEFVELEVTTADKGCYINADKPVAVGSFLTGMNYVGLKVGDPAFAWVPPIEQTVDQVAIAPFIPQSESNPRLKNGVHYALLVTKTSDKAITTMGIGENPENPLTGGTWVDHSSGYSFYSLQMKETAKTYTFANPEGMTILGYGVGEFESYYYLAASSSRILNAYFNINDVHYQDFDGNVFCNSGGFYTLEAIVNYPLSPDVGHIRWFVNDMEQESVKDVTKWTLDYIEPDVSTTITLRITNSLGEETDISTTFSVSSIETPTVTPAGTQPFFSGEYVTLTSTEAYHYQWYLNGEEIPGANSRTYNAGTEGIYSVKVTSPMGCESEFSNSVIVHLYPDNISEEDCYITPEVTNWKPVLKATTAENVHILAQPFVGDIDGDGKMEVVTTNQVGTSGYATSNEILIFDNELKLKKRFSTATMCTNTATPMVLVRLQPTDQHALIIVACSDFKLRAYNPDGNLVWESDSKFFINSSEIAASVCLVAGDINNDGVPEILAVDGIFDAVTGKLLASLPAGGRGYRLLNGSASNHTYMPALADLDNDGQLEVVAGNTTYKVNIQDRNDKTKNTVTVLASAKHAMGDGYVSIADVDLDGQPDVVVVTQGTNPSVTVWNGITGDIIAGPKIASVAGGGGSRAFIGDVDNDGYPEIFFSYANQLVGFDFVPGASTIANKLSQKWIVSTSDGSGGTTLSMFDFDQDGKAELVYRDETHLRIIDGETGSNRETINCHSATHSEYPIVVDLDGDGHADIIVSGAASSAAQGNDVRLYWFTGEDNDWAPARRVWNQHGYNSIHVNEDLTIPRFQLNPSTVFTGKDGLQTIRPYNGYLLQQTVLSKDGESLFLTPNAQIESPENIGFDFNMVTDILTISGLKITNVGSAPLNAPVSMAIYKDSESEAFFVHTYGTSIAAGQTVTVPDFTIPSFGTYLPVTSLIIKVNDNGKGEKIQPTCEDCEPVNSGSFNGIEMDAVAWADPYRNCEGGTVVFKSANLNAATFEWINPSGTSFAISAETSKANLLTTDGGEYTFKATGVNGNLNITYKLPYLSVAPATMYWSTNATDNNWYNFDNWATDINGTALANKAIPAPCTSVHIPGNAANFPSLDEVTTPTNIYGIPEVENITFHYQSELAHQHRLKYRKAFVQYNFGYYNSTTGGNISNADGNYSPVLDRDKWYVLATPLKKVASGDFALAGYPFSWQAKHEVASIGNGTLTGVQAIAHASNDVDLEKNGYNSISLKMAGYNAATGYNDHKNLEGLKGIIELPYFENEVTGNYYGSHKYDRFTGTSYFYYYNTSTLQQVHSPVGSMKRGEEAYRFIYEDENGNVPTISALNNVAGYTLKVTAPSGSGNRVLIGNPFLASINAGRFYQANAAVIEGTTYLVYNSSTQAWESIPYNDATYTHINSFQSFIVTLKSAGETELYFPLEGTYALTEPGEVGNVPAMGIIPLEITAVDRNGNGEKAQLTAATYSDLVRSEEKIVSISEHAVPEVFFVDNQENKYNLIQLYNKDIAELGIGVKASQTDIQLTLNFENVDNFVYDTRVEQLVLVDKVTGKQQDVTRNTQYTFIHKGNPADGQYIDTERFVLKLADTAIANSENITIYYKDKAIYVEGIDVNYVHVFDISGTKLCELSKSEMSYVPLNQGVYIVKAFGKDGKQKTARIMVK